MKPKQTIPAELQPAYDWLIDRMSAMSSKAVASMVDLDHSSLLKLKNGNYNGNLTNALLKIEKVRLDQMEEMLSGARVPFINTKIAERIASDCRAAQRDSSLVIISGAPQVGKTEALYNYQQNHQLSGKVYIARCPVRPTMASLARRILATLGLPNTWNTDEALDRIAEALEPSDLLIIDEAHQPFYSSNTTACVQVWEWLREMCDMCMCGKVLCTTELFSARLNPRARNPHQLTPTDKRNANMAGVLSQLERRGEIDVLPSMMDEEDVARILSAYNLELPASPAAADYIISAAQSYGIGRFTRRMRIAAREAARQGKNFSTDCFLITNKRIAREA